MATNKNNIKYLKIHVEAIQSVILIKLLNDKQVDAIYQGLRKKVADLNTHILATSYYKEVLKYTMKDYSKFVEKINGEKEKTQEYAEILRIVYKHVIDFYPTLSLNVICLDLDATNFLQGQYESKSGPFSEVDEASVEVSFRDAMKQKDRIDKGWITKFSAFLKHNLVGQEEAIATVVSTLKVIASRLSTRSSMFFIGPTGVGKTELARLIGQEYSDNFMVINCAEYAAQHEYSKLIGSPPGYIGHNEKSLLATKADKSNSWVFLFDEIEKANEKLFDCLLSLLDTGTITDSTGRVLDFTESIFVFTSNQGVSDIRTGASIGFDGKEVSYDGSKDEVKNSVTKKFSPEFINRIDSFVYFNSLTKEDAKKITLLNLKKLPIKATEGLVNHIVNHSFSEKYGARSVARFIKAEILPKIAETLLEEGRIAKKGEYFTVDVINEKVTIANALNEAKA